MTAVYGRRPSRGYLPGSALPSRHGGAATRPSRSYVATPLPSILLGRALESDLTTSPSTKAR